MTVTIELIAVGGGMNMRVCVHRLPSLVLVDHEFNVPLD
jgi:hypothetical protein